MAKSQHLREAIFHLIEQTNNDLAVQIDQTNFDFRKRIYEMKRAKEELEYQMKKVRLLFHYFKLSFLGLFPSVLAYLILIHLSD